MVPILSLSKKLRIVWISILALFGSELESLAGNRVTNITLDGQDSVLLGAAKITLIVPRGCLERHPSEDLN